ncbi:MAG: glutamate--tRNA ligase [bacterium]|nr:glutamate--tRNA ligase [bacterium]
MENDTDKVIVRMAPSPTGKLHVGGVRTALFNYLFAKKFKGKFILRIEDTDKERSTKEFEDDIISGFEWLQLKYDEFYKQSERIDIYKSYLLKMIENGTAYTSKETPREEGQRDEVIRFKNPRIKVKFNDLIRGDVEFDTTELGDFVIAKSTEEPLYHLAVVIDDHQMGITHIIRGEEHLSNTPRQILIQEAIGAKRPIYAHLPLLLDADRKKLSKRVHGEEVWAAFYKREGYLPDALLNFLALLGWNPGGDREIFNLEDLIEAFDIKDVQKGGAVFDVKKLRWVNKEHIKKMSLDKLIDIINEKINLRFPNKSISPKINSLLIDRLEVLKDIDSLVGNGEFDYFFEKPEIDLQKINWKGENKENTKKYLQKSLELLEKIDFESEDSIKNTLMPYAETVGKGNVLWPLRFSLSGKEKSPDPFTLIFVLGKEETTDRISRVIELL